jgi:hypothetical protein
MAKKRKWYSYFYDYSWEKEVGYSASSYWTGRFGGTSWFNSSDEEKYRSALRTVSKTVNIYTSSAESKKEKNFKVKFSGGSNVNNLLSQDIFLSPDVISDGKTKKPKWNNDELADVLVGDALTESAIKYEATRAAENYANRDHEGREMIRDLWYTSEIVNAQSKVCDVYPGFRSYLATSRNYYTWPGAFKMLQKAVTNKRKMNAKVAERVLEWQMLHSGEPLTIPVGLRRLFKKSLKKIGSARNSRERASKATEVVEDFLKIWPEEHDKKKPPPKKKLPSGSGGDGKAAIPSVTSIGVSQVPGQKISGNRDAAHVKLDDGTPGGKGISFGDDCPEGTVDHVVKPTAAFATRYRSILSKVAPAAKAVAERLQVLNEERKDCERGTLSGRIDEGALYRVGFRKHGVDDDHLFEREEIISAPDTAIVLLVDESGSMNGGGSIERAREVAIILSEALSRVRGINYAVLGHTGQGYGHTPGPCDGMILHHYYSPRTHDRTTLGGINATSENFDGYAIKRCGEYIYLWWPHVKNRMVVHVSDGMPAARGYGGTPARNHVSRVCKTLLSKGVSVTNIFVGGHYREVDGELDRMYGTKNWESVPRAEDCPKAVTNLIVNRLKKNYLAQEV